MPRADIRRFRAQYGDSPLERTKFKEQRTSTVHEEGTRHPCQASRRTNFVDRIIIDEVANHLQISYDSAYQYSTIDLGSTKCVQDGYRSTETTH